jgi:hypothetical protein
MIPPLTRLTLAFTLTAAISLPALAEVILLRQSIQEAPANNSSGLQRPTAGMRMSEVTLRFGEPMQRRESVGNPPITRWIYDRYTVYFEYDRVVNAVVRRPAYAAVVTAEIP